MSDSVVKRQGPSCDGLRCDGRLEVDPYCTLHGDIGRAHYGALLDAERRALAYREFIAYTLDEFGDLLSSQWKAHARAALADDPGVV